MCDLEKELKELEECIENTENNNMQISAELSIRKEKINEIQNRPLDEKTSEKNIDSTKLKGKNKKKEEIKEIEKI